MRVRLFGCRKFGRLLNEREDRQLSEVELQFLGRHRSVCSSCRREEAASQLSLNMLRAAALDIAPGNGFDERLMRRLRITRVRESLSYWSPALVGSAIACLTLLVTLQLLSGSRTSNSASMPNGEARRDTTSFPQLELKQLPPFGR